MENVNQNTDLDKLFKAVPRYKNVKVNALGTVVMYDEKELKITTMGKVKYLQVSFGGKSHYIHRLVAMAFVLNNSPVSKKLVVHVDGNLENNHFENLKWCSPKELVEIQKKNGVFVGTSEERLTSKISKDDAMKIAERLDKGEKAKDIAIEYGVSDMSITRIRQRYCKNRVASRKYGYEIKSTVAELFKAGHHSDKKIAAITGITYETIYRWRKKFNVKKFPIDGTKGLNGQPIKHGKRKTNINYNV
jgi:hypothetical protein